MSKKTSCANINYNTVIIILLTHLKILEEWMKWSLGKMMAARIKAKPLPTEIHSKEISYSAGLGGDFQLVFMSWVQFISSVFMYLQANPQGLGMFI